MIKTCLTVLVAGALLLPSVSDARQSPTLSTGMALMNHYIWRGIVLSREPVVQPSATLSCDGLALNFWGNVDLTHANNYDGRLNEVDYRLDYSIGLRRFSLSSGIIHYTFPNTGAGSTTEFYLGLAHCSALQPSIKIYQDVDQADGTYVSLGLAPSIPLTAWNSSLELSLSLGLGSADHNRFYYGSGAAAFSDILAGVSLPFNLSGKTTLTPSLAYTGLLDSSIRAARNRDDNFLAGVTFSFSF